MAEQARNDALNTLQEMLDDALIQTGKAMQDLRLDGIDVAKETIQAQLPETIRTFHNALDSLESEIVSAKSVMQRDLAQVRSKNGQPTIASVPPPAVVQPSIEKSQEVAPQPVQSQTKSPMVIDLESSPMAAETSGTSQIVKTESVPMAMAQQQPPEAANRNSDPVDIKSEAPQPSAPAAVANMAPMAPDNAVSGANGEHQVKTEPKAEGDPTTTGPDDNDGLNFTNMTFSLAPPANEANMSANASEPSFDLSSFAPGNNNDNSNNDNTMNFDDFSMPQNAGPTGGDQQQQGEQGSGDGGLDDFDFSLDSGAGDGMDFDFSLGGSAGDGNLGEFAGGDSNNNSNNNNNNALGGDFDADLFFDTNN